MMPTRKAAVDDLFTHLSTFDGLDAFCLLPELDQERFVEWIVRAHNDASYWARIEAIALAMRLGPLQPTVGLTDVAEVLRGSGTEH